MWCPDKRADAVIAQSVGKHLLSNLTCVAAFTCPCPHAAAQAVRYALRDHAFDNHPLHLFSQPGIGTVAVCLQGREQPFLVW